MSSSGLTRLGGAWRLYSPARAKKIIGRLADCIGQMQERYGIPGAYLQAVLFQEMTAIDVLDILADWGVELYWIKFGLLSGVRRILKKPPLREFPGGALNKRDSSTGYAQVFGRTAILAIRFSLEKGLDEGPQALGLPGVPDENEPDDLRRVWYRLHRDPRFNLRMAALTLLSAAEEMTGRIDFSGYSPEEIQLIFTRYNASAKAVTAYGREAYQYYIGL